MAAIDPVDGRTAAEQGLGSDLESFARLGDSSSEFLRILARVPGYAAALWGAMSEALFKGGVDHRLKEMIRIQLATAAGSRYFSELRSIPAIEAGLTEDRIEAAITGFETDPGFSEAERWALRYAHRMYRDPAAVDAAFYAEGKTHFTEAQIMEIGGLIAIHYGMASFMAALEAGDLV
jgi:alkylhydroperoxidase family enzyme